MVWHINAHLFPALLHVPEIVNDETFKVSQFLDEPAKLQVSFRNEQILHQKAEVVKYIRRPRAISSWPIAQRR